MASLPVGHFTPATRIAHPAIFLLPHREATWKIVKERLDGLEQSCASLGRQEGLGVLAKHARKPHSIGQDVGDQLGQHTALSASTPPFRAPGWADRAADDEVR
jgi:hypothetical protein